MIIANWQYLFQRYTCVCEVNQTWLSDKKTWATNQSQLKRNITIYKEIREIEMSIFIWESEEEIIKQ